MAWNGDGVPMFCLAQRVEKAGRSAACLDVEICQVRICGCPIPGNHLFRDDHGLHTAQRWDLIHQVEHHFFQNRA